MKADRQTVTASLGSSEQTWPWGGPHPAPLSLDRYNVMLPSVLSPGEEVSCCWDNFRDSFPLLLSLNSLLKCAY